MSKNGYDTLIEEVDKCIPYYTLHLMKLKGIIDVQKKLTDILISCNPSGNFEVFREIEKMNTFNGLLTISLLDLLVVCKNLCLARKDWERIYFIKQSYLIIYETVKSIRKYNTFFNQITKTKYPYFDDTYKGISKALKQFKKENNYDNWIEVVRNKVAGHIDEDFILYYDTIRKMDGEIASITISNFLKLHIQYLNLSKDIAAYANSLTKIENKKLNIQIIDIKKEFDILMNSLISKAKD